MLTPTEQQLIWVCKGNYQAPLDKFKQVLGEGLALPAEFVSSNMIAYALLEIVQKYNLTNDFLSFILYECGKEKWGWHANFGLDFSTQNAILTACASKIELAPIDKFPNYEKKRTKIRS